MKVEMRDLREGPVELQLSEAPKHLELADEQFGFPDPVTGSVRFQLINDKVLGHGKVSTTVESKCVRCLETVRTPITGQVDAMYENNPELQKPEHSFLGQEDSATVYFNGEYIDPSPEIREAIMIELPALPLCSDDCKSLCPRCGANLNRETCTCEPLGEDEAGWKKSLRNLKLE